MADGESRRKAHSGGAERRRHPRIELVGVMRGHTSNPEVSISVLDMSAGGFAMQTSTSLPVGVIHDFLLTPAVGAPLKMPARIVRTMCSSGPGGSTQYISGVEFLTDENAISALRAVEACRRNVGREARRHFKLDATGRRSNRAGKGKSTAS
ncbi:MAG: hypothetical protein GEU82_10825 [Luteitalea sp.]|nr:hypothetical protein [Luteitalea sp.]